MTQRRLLGLFAHPDDESRIVGGTRAKYASEGVEVTLVVATRGEDGPCGEPPLCTPEELPEILEQELREACSTLGVTNVAIPDYRDGTLGTVDRSEPIGHLVAAIRRVRPHVILTFGPEGRTLHADHIAIHETVAAAFHLAAAPGAYPKPASPPHADRKLYYTTLRQSLVDAVNWVYPGQPDEEITVALDVHPWIEQKQRATNEAHRTRAHDQPFANLAKEDGWKALSTEYFVLAATHGVTRSRHGDDLFDGISR